MNTASFDIAVLAGDGIGPEITPITLEILNLVAKKFDFTLNFKELDAGAAYYAKHGISLPDDALNIAKCSDAILLACMGLPSIRYPDGREIAPQLEIREKLALYAGVRPVKCISEKFSPLKDPRAQTLDFVLIRESTEGLFASRDKSTLEDDAVATDTQVITRKGSERLFNFAFQLAGQRKGNDAAVTCVDKANVLGSFYFFRKIFDEVSAGYPHIKAGHMYVDAAGLQLVKQPWIFDVIVTENMFGDILSDIGAGLLGGMGMAPSADIGDEHALFQPCHGSAPDIVGEGKANPIAMFLSAAMMLQWLSVKSGNTSLSEAADLIELAVKQAVDNDHIMPMELGGNAGTQEIFESVKKHILSAD